MGGVASRKFYDHRTPDPATHQCLPENHLDNPSTWGVHLRQLLDRSTFIENHYLKRVFRGVK